MQFGDVNATVFIVFLLDRAYSFTTARTEKYPVRLNPVRTPVICLVQFLSSPTMRLRLILDCKLVSNTLLLFHTCTLFTTPTVHQVENLCVINGPGETY
jgi:hypothetical protein